MPKHIASGLKYLAAVKLKEAGEPMRYLMNQNRVEKL